MGNPHCRCLVWQYGFLRTRLLKDARRLGKRLECQDESWVLKDGADYGDSQFGNDARFGVPGRQVRRGARLLRGHKGPNSYGILRDGLVQN